MSSYSEESTSNRSQESDLIFLIVIEVGIGKGNGSEHRRQDTWSKTTAQRNFNKTILGTDIALNSAIPYDIPTQRS